MNKGLVKFLICSSLIAPIYDISTHIIDISQAKEVRKSCNPDHVYEISKDGDVVNISFKKQLTSQTPDYAYKGIEELGQCNKILVKSEVNLSENDIKYVADQAQLGATEIDFSQAKMEQTYKMTHDNTNLNHVTKIVLPEGLKTIGKDSFYNLSYLKEVNIPNSVTAIEDNAFNSCASLKGSLKLSENLKTIGNKAFYRTGFTGDLIIPDSVTDLGSYAFSDCQGFDGKIKLSKNLTKINYQTFSYCKNLTGNLTIPDSVTSIGGEAFNCCYNLIGDLIIPDSITSIGDRAFKETGFDGELKLSETMTEISPGTFYSSKISGIKGIPNSIESISGGAFSRCYNLKGQFVISTQSNLKFIDTDAFADTDGISISIGSPKVNEYKVNDTTINGTIGNLGRVLLFGYPQVRVNLNNQYYEAKADGAGRFKIQVPKLKEGDVFSINIRYTNEKGEYEVSLSDTLYVGSIKLSVSQIASTYITGKTLPNIKTTAKINGKYYSSNSNENGVYKINIPTLKYGDKISVYSKKHNVYSNIEKITIKPTKPTVSTLKVNLVKGKADANVKVTVRIGNKYYSSKSTKYGNYAIKIPTQRYGTKVKVYCKENNIYSEIREVTIKPTKPTVSTLKVNLVKGKADANVKVTVRIGNKYYSSKATKYGNYSIKIPTQKYGTKIKVYAKSSNGVYSDIREIKITK